MELDPHEQEWVAFVINLPQEDMDRYMESLIPEEREYLKSCIELFKLDVIDAKVSNSNLNAANDILKNFMIQKRKF